MANMDRLESIVAALPEAERVDIAEWGDHPTFRVRGKNFVFSDQEARHLSLKLSTEEAEAVVATDSKAEPAGYGLGRHGWISFELPARPSAARWKEVEEWVRTSYTLVAPKKLARQILDGDATSPTPGASAEAPTTVLTRISAEKVRHATGRGWEEWFAELDRAGATAWKHREIVAHLGEAHPELSSWWLQTLSVGYEHARGMRVAGQTGAAGFEIGVSRTVEAGVDEVWELLTSRPELWLGAGTQVELRKGERYQLRGGARTLGATGEVRVVTPRKRLRLTWQPKAWSAPATIQLTLTTARSGRTTIGAHMEKLPDAEAREEMRTRWREALERVEAALS